jgi:serine/threonine protein kinase, bacterial
MRNFRKALCCLAAIAILSVGCIKTSTIIPHTPPPAIGALSPSHGPDSTLVTISGAAFSDTLANDAVFFNGKQAMVVSATDTTLVAMVPTLAGSGSVTITVDGASTTAGVFTYDTTWRVSMVADSIYQNPWYVALDANNELYVPAYGGQTLFKINDTTGSISPLATMYATGAAIGGPGNGLYVVAYTGPTANFERVDPVSGATTLIAQDSGFVLGLAVDAAGNLYAGNSTRNLVEKVTPAGVISVIDSGLFSVSGVAVASDGTVYATNYNVNAYDNSAGVITKITPAGDTSTFAHFFYDGEAGITIDANNNLYVTNFNQEYALGDVIKISPSGTLTPLISTTNLMFPAGIVRDASGNLYVVQSADAPGSYYGSVVKLTMH